MKGHPEARASLSRYVARKLGRTPEERAVSLGLLEEARRRLRALVAPAPPVAPLACVHDYPWRECQTCSTVRKP